MVRNLGLQLVLQLVLQLTWQLIGPHAGAPAQAQSHRTDSAGTAASQRYIERAQAALGQKDFRLASEQLTQAFAIKRRADVLYYLGLVALGQNRLLEAQDLMRRYLADPARLPDEPAAAQAQRVLGMPRPPSGQVVILGEAGALLWIDERLVGDLPLSHPLLLSPGEHRVALAYKAGRQESPVLVQSGRVLELRFTRGTGAVLISLRPAALWVVEYTAVKGETQNLFRDAADHAAQGQQQSLLDVEAALPQAPVLAACYLTLSCKRELARKNQLEHVLDASVGYSEAAGGVFHITARLFHTQVEPPAAEAKSDCPACTPEQAAQALRAAVKQVLAHGLFRHPATLTVDSVPMGAEVAVDGVAAGQTPFSQQRWSGALTLTVRKPGYEPERRSIELGEGESVPVRLELSPQPVPVPQAAPRPAAPARRPRWRLALGGVLVGTGAVLGGFGISALYVDGKCYSADGIKPCTSPLEPQFQVGPLGGGLLGTGVGLSLIGSAMMVWPPPRPGSAR